MAVIATQGFGSSTNIADYTNTGALVAGPTSMSIQTGGTFGDNYLNLFFQSGNGGAATLLAFPASTSFYVGMRCSHSVNNSIYYYLVDGAGGRQLTLNVDPNSGVLTLRRGDFGTVLGTSAPNVAPNNNVFHYIEIGGTINATTGSIIVKVDGATVITVTAANTAGTSTLNVGSLVWATSGITGTCRYQHMYACDNTGSTNNTFLGDVRIQTVLPAGASTPTNFTPTGAATNWQVASTYPPSATVYNTSTNVGDVDMFTTSGSGVAAAAVVLAVTVKALAVKPGGGSRFIATKLKSSATTFTGTSQTVPVTGTYAADTANLDPNGNIAWTPAAVNAATLGYSLAG